MKEKIKYLVVWVSLILTSLSCVTQRNSLHETGGINEALRNSISNFSKTKFFKNNDVFVVSYSKDFIQYSLIKQADGTYSWLPDKSYPDLYAISILDDNSKFLYDTSELGQKNTSLPTSIMIKDGKLFYWWDDKVPLSKETVNILFDYKLLEQGDKYLDFSSDDSKKAVHFYFCKDDLANYKKVVNSKAIGYYEPPKLNCN